MDGLSRQLSRAAAEKEDVERELHTLLDSLRNTEQVDHCTFTSYPLELAWQPQLEKKLQVSVHNKIISKQLSSDGPCKINAPIVHWLPLIAHVSN